MSAQEFKPYGELVAFVHVSLTEDEAKALDALAGYGADAFLKVFYEKMGKAYLQPYEKGLRSLFDKVRDQVPAVSRHLDDTRAVFRGSKVAVRSEDLERLQQRSKELADIKKAQADPPLPAASDQPTPKEPE